MKINLVKVRGGLPLAHRNSYETVLRNAQEICGFESVTGILQIILLPKDQMAELNYASLKHEGPTDVLTFDLRDSFSVAEDDLPVVGEIYVCPEVARDYAQAHGLSASRELVLYAVHGMLHLTGQDDHTESDLAAMRAQEARVMSELESRSLRLEQYI